MARIPRKFTVKPHRQTHKVWRAHNKEFNLLDPKNKAVYLKYMNDLFKKRESPDSDKPMFKHQIHAYCLMSNHTHEVYTVEDQPSFSNFMQRHHTRYGMYFNRTHNRSGKVAEDRPYTTLTEDDWANLQVIFYVHANPYLASMGRGVAENYQWSTFKLYAYGKRLAGMENIKLPRCYLKLGKTPEQRQKRFRKLFFQYLRRRGYNAHSLYMKFVGTEKWVEEQLNTVKEATKLSTKEKYDRSKDPP